MPLLFFHFRFGHEKCPRSGTYFQVRNYIRVVVMGAEGVGKTALINQCLNRTFTEKHKRTIEEQYFYSGHNFDVEILDTSGSYNFPDMMKIAIQQGDVFVLVFSVIDYKTFDRVSQLRKNIMDIRGRVPMIIVGNKADEKDREVPYDIADAVASIDWNCTYHDVTAKDNDAVTAIFNDIFTHYPALCGEKITLRHRQSQQSETEKGKRHSNRKSARLSDFVKKLWTRN